MSWQLLERNSSPLAAAFLPWLQISSPGSSFSTLPAPFVPWQQFSFPCSSFPPHQSDAVEQLFEPDSSVSLLAAAFLLWRQAAAFFPWQLLCSPGSSLLTLQQVSQRDCSFPPLASTFLPWLPLSSPSSSFPSLAAVYSPGSSFSHMTPAFLNWISSPLSTVLTDKQLP